MSSDGFGPSVFLSAANVIEHARLEAARPVRPGREAHLVAHPSEDTVLAIERRAGADIDAPAKVTGVGLDVVFPVLHGPYGEDGTIQGLLELAQSVTGENDDDVIYQQAMAAVRSLL